MAKGRRRRPPRPRAERRWRSRSARSPGENSFVGEKFPLPSITRLLSLPAERASRVSQRARHSTKGGESQTQAKGLHPSPPPQSLPLLLGKRLPLNNLATHQRLGVARRDRETDRPHRPHKAFNRIPRRRRRRERTPLQARQRAGCAQFLAESPARVSLLAGTHTSEGLAATPPRGLASPDASNSRRRRLWPPRVRNSTAPAQEVATREKRTLRRRRVPVRALRNRKSSPRNALRFSRGPNSVDDNSLKEGNLRFKASVKLRRQTSVCCRPTTQPVLKRRRQERGGAYSTHSPGSRRHGRSSQTDRPYSTLVAN